MAGGRPAPKVSPGPAEPVTRPPGRTPGEATAAPVPLTVEQAMLAATRTQARATWASALIAVMALVVALAAGYSQLRLNAQQADLNDAAKARAERVNAARVAVWAQVGPDESSVRPAGLDVTIQNRSPVPLQQVHVLAPLGNPAGEGSADVGELLPCTLVTFRLVPPADGAFRIPANSWLGYPGLRLRFGETGREWMLDNGRLRTPTELDEQELRSAAASALRVLKPMATAAGDCGEAG